MSDLLEASESISTLQELLDRDIEADSVKKFGSHSRNLMKVRRGLQMVRVLFEEIIASEYVLALDTIFIVLGTEKKTF